MKRAITAPARRPTRAPPQRPPCAASRQPPSPCCRWSSHHRPRSAALAPSHAHRTHRTDFPALFGRALGLRRGVAPPVQPLPDRHRQQPAQLARLVVAALAQPAIVQRHRHQRWTPPRRRCALHQLREQASGCEILMELVADQQLVDRWQVQQAGVGSRLWRYLLAAAATDDQRGVGQRQRAAQAGTACPGRSAVQAQHRSRSSWPGSPQTGQRSGSSTPSSARETRVAERRR